MCVCKGVVQMEPTRPNKEILFLTGLRGPVNQPGRTRTGPDAHTHTYTPANMFAPQASACLRPYRDPTQYWRGMGGGGLQHDTIPPKPSKTCSPEPQRGSLQFVV